MSIYTEEEARTKWCPKVARDPRDKTLAPGMCCIASECAVWQWVRATDTRGYRNDHYPDAYKYEKTEGYCGLAGKAQP